MEKKITVVKLLEELKEFLNEQFSKDFSDVIEKYDHCTAKDIITGRLHSDVHKFLGYGNAAKIESMADRIGISSMTIYNFMNTVSNIMRIRMMRDKNDDVITSMYSCIVGATMASRTLVPKSNEERIALVDAYHDIRGVKCDDYDTFIKCIEGYYGHLYSISSIAAGSVYDWAKVTAKTIDLGDIKKLVFNKTNHIDASLLAIEKSKDICVRTMATNKYNALVTACIERIVTEIIKLGLVGDGRAKNVCTTVSICNVDGCDENGVDGGDDNGNA